jgi:hypothetical protein
LQIRQHSVTILLLICLLTCVDVSGAITQHALDQSGQLMCGRRHRLGCAQPRPHPTGIRSQGTVTVGQALGCQPQGRRRPVGRWFTSHPVAFAA